MRPDGRGRTALSKRGVAAFDAAWLPKTIVYISNAMGGMQLVRAAKAAPGAAVSVVVRADDAPNIGSVSAAKEVRILAFQTQIRDVWNIATVKPDGTDLMVIGEGNNPRISPDGTRIAFEKEVNSRWQVFTMDIEGGDLTQVTDFEATNGAPEWSPDGKWIVFASDAGSARFADPNAVMNLFVIRPDGTQLAQLTDGPRKSTEPCWGSDGWIYFASDEGGTYDLWRLKPVLE
jgi:TolB protein